MPDFIYKGKVYYNPAQLVVEQIGGIWKMPILWRLINKTMRYNELRKDIPHISDKMLTTQLKELENDGYIIKTIYAEIPPRTEYNLTTQGEEIIKIISQLREFGKKLISESETKTENGEQ